MTTLDGGVIIKKGGGGGTPINNQDKVVDITENGTTEVVADGGFTGLGKVTINTEVEGAKPKWTGHADAEGLRAIGWTDEDIAYYQENSVNWNEEDDECHKVSEDNKALYGVLTASNISSYRDRIVYLPKIDTSKVTDMSNLFKNCYCLTAIPMLDTSKVTNMSYMFNYCYCLTAIPMLDTSKVTKMNQVFYNCRALTAIPMLDTSNVINMSRIFYGCSCLTAIPMLDTSKVTDMSDMFGFCTNLTAIPMLDTSKVTDMRGMFNGCYCLTATPILDTSKVTNMSDMFGYSYCLTHVNLKNIKLAYNLSSVTLLTKSSLLYIINNEAAESAIIIKLASYAYDKWATDPDIVAALANHPNISLAK